MKILVLHPWERLKVLHDPKFQPNRSLYHREMTYTRACREVERGEMEWIRGYLAPVPVGSWVKKSSGYAGPHVQQRVEHYRKN